MWEQNGAMVAQNDNWRTTQESDIMATGMAPMQDSEAALVVTLQPGVYTTLLNGVGGGTGIGLLDVFLVE